MTTFGIENKREVEIAKRKMVYWLKNPRKGNRHIRLSIGPDGKVFVSCPCGVDEQKIKSFVIKSAKWIFEKIEFLKQRNASRMIKISRKDFLKEKSNAFKLAKSRADYFSVEHNFSYKEISIRNQKTRWGSCSSKGNLNFNYGIVFLPAKLLNYVILHEMCHLKEMNHSKKFWRLMEEIMPDYLERRKELTRTSLAIS